MKTIIFDWKRTLYDPENRCLIKGTIKLLKMLKRKNPSLILIGKGGEDMSQEVKRLKLENYFSTIVFKDKKDIEVFKSFVSKNEPKSTVIVGDRVRSEIEIGNCLKATTIWIKQGKFANELPINEKQQPTFTVFSLSELNNLLAKLI
jgi:ribonucleotide monophosphatase NagD (HAD superfamily)